MPDRESVAWHVSLAGRALSRTIEAELSERDLGRGEYRVLFALAEREGLSQTDLVERHHLEKSSIARVVAQLESKGYVETRADPEDGRRKRLYLTETGQALQDDVAAVKDRTESRLTAGLSADERDTLVAHLRTVCRNLDVELPEGEV